MSDTSAIPRLPAPRNAALLNAMAWFSVVTAVFMFGRGYFGFVHDNMLYLAQALARLYPDIYLGDIYLAWGSQDRYTVFSPVYAWLIAHLGLAAANLVIVITAQALFLAASFLCVRAWLPAGVRGLAMLFIAASNGLYGSGFIFKMGEQFATPRPLVEASVLLGLALVFAGRRVWPFLILLIGAALHPLVALTGFLFAWTQLVLADRRWLWLLTLGFVPLGGALAGVPPFDQLLQTFDAQWLEAILLGSQHVFVTEWALLDWSLVAWDVAVLYMTVNLATGRVRDVARTALAVAAVSLGITLVGADLLRNVLVTNLQVWRAMWLVHWVAAAALPWLLMRLWEERTPGALLAAGLALFGFFLRGLPAALLSSLVSLALFAGRREVAMRPLLLKGALAALAAGAFLHWFANVMRRRDRLADESLRPALDFLVDAFSRPFALAVVGAAIATLLLRREHVRTAAGLSLALLIAAVLSWDRRAPIKRHIETAPLGSHPFSRYVEPHQEVLWYEDPSAPWVMMQRKSYISSAQAAGQMFSRETAAHLRERRAIVNALEFQEQFCQFMNKGNRREDSCEDDVELLVEACRDAKDLAFIVLESRRGKAWVAQWTPPVQYAAYRPTYYLYACRELAGR